MAERTRNKRSSKQVSAARLAEMRRLYEEEGLTLAAVGERFGISRQRVHAQLSEAGIQTRPNSPKTVNCDLLYTLYVVGRLSIRRTAEKLGVCQKVVKRELDRFGLLKRRGTQLQIDRGLLEYFYVQQRLSQIETAKRLGVAPRVIVRELRRHEIAVRNLRRHPVRIEHDELHTLYVNGKLSVCEVSRRLGHDAKTVSRELRRNGIPSRKPGPIERPREWQTADAQQTISA